MKSVDTEAKLHNEYKISVLRRLKFYKIRKIAFYLWEIILNPEII